MAGKDESAVDPSHRNQASDPEPPGWAACIVFLLLLTFVLWALLCFALWVIRTLFRLVCRGASKLCELWKGGISREDPYVHPTRAPSPETRFLPPPEEELHTPTYGALSRVQPANRLSLAADRSTAAITTALQRSLDTVVYEPRVQDVALDRRPWGSDWRGTRATHPSAEPAPEQSCNSLHYDLHLSTSMRSRASPSAPASGRTNTATVLRQWTPDLATGQESSSAGSQWQLQSPPPTPPPAQPVPARREDLPEFTGELHPFQHDHLIALMGRENFVHDMRRQPLETSAAWSGMILAYATGLGKTVVTIAFACVLVRRNRIDRNLAPILILCPSVDMLRQWESEFERFTKGLRVLAYHASEGRGFRMEACELLYYDIVIATYAQLREQHAYYIKVVAGELPPGEAVQPNRYPFYEVPFQMVAADEAQMMKNPNGQTGAAVLALLREFTLLLSATLIQNFLSDLYMPLKVVGKDYRALSRLSKPTSRWDGYFQAVCNDRLVGERQTIEAILKEVTICRRDTSSLTHQGLPLLPCLHTHALEIVLSGAERVLYKYVTEGIEYRAQVVEFTRARQASVDPSLLMNALQPVELAECSETSDDISDVEDSSIVEGSSLVDLDDLPRVMSRRAGCPPGVSHLLDIGYSSTKVRKACDIVVDITSSRPEKVIVYSTFKGSLKSVARLLERSNISYVMFHGDLTETQRTDALRRIAVDDSCSVLLMTMQSGGMGLNITSCNHVIFLEPWWNPYVETQAIGRVHRIGQKRDVHVYRIIAKDTIETTDVIPTQERKKTRVEALMNNIEVRGIR